MAITAKFGADFAAFNDAVESSTAKLAGYESNATKVGAALNRMAESYSGTKVIQDATLATEAVTQLGGAATLTADQQKRLSASLDEAIAKMTAMGQTVPPAMQAMADSVRKVPPEVDGVKSSLGSMSDQVVATAAGFVSAEAILGAFTGTLRATIGLVQESVAAYSKQEDAEVRLTAALHQHGLATPQVIAQYNELATTFQNTTKYADEDINAMEALLTQVGNVMPSQMDRALKASTDLASGLGIDLERATMLVAKAAAGHTETLGRYGITVDAAEVKTRGLSAVLDVIETQFGGQASAVLDTYSGKVAQIKNAWDNVEEALGRIILQDPLVSAALGHILDAAKDADKGSKDASATVADLAYAIGLVDRPTADAANAIAIMTTKVETLSYESAKGTHAMSDYGFTVDKLAASMQNPGITEGLRIQAELVKKHAEEVKADEEAQKKFEAALVAVSAVGDGYAGTLATIDGATVEGIKYYLQAGVAQSDLAALYGLTAAQIKSVAEALKDEAEATKAQAEMDKEEFSLKLEMQKVEREERTRTLNLVNAGVVEALNVQIAYNKSIGLDATGAVQSTDKALVALTARLEQIANMHTTDAAKATLVADAERRYTDALVDEAKAADQADVASQGLKKTQGDLGPALDAATSQWGNFRATIKLTAASMDDLNHQLDVANAKMAQRGAIGTPVGNSFFSSPTSGPGVGNLSSTSAWIDSVLFGGRSFVDGGPTGPTPGPAYLHEDEYVVPRGGALVMGGGGGLGPLTINVMMPDGQVLASVVTSEMTRDMLQGRLWPTR